MIAGMLLNHLAKIQEDAQTKTPLRILATSTTPQGVKTLKENTKQIKQFSLTINFFPLDAPFVMEKAFHFFQPRLAILVETELWPAFLIYASKKQVPVMVINGRMSQKSYAAYRKIAPFFKHFGPQKVLAMSPQDASRFAQLLGQEKVTALSNLKFDNIASSKHKENILKELLPDKDSPFVVFGSIRKQEEIQIINSIYRLLNSCPNLTIGFFPKRTQRAAAIIKRMAALGIQCTLRSSLNTQPITPGKVIIWDQFGELATAYQYAETAFVGGSLYPQGGGQNLIEPLIAGIRPLTGKFWHDFAWLGKEVIELKLIEEVANDRELATALIKRIEAKENKKENQLRAEKYLAAKRGSTAVTCTEIMKFLQPHNR